MKKFFSLVAAMFLAGNMFAAADVYLSATGNDANAGTAEAPVATLVKANELVDENGTIHVSGMVKVSERFDMTKHLKIVGTSAETDGFDAQGSSQILYESNKYLTLQNLKFVNGHATGEKNSNTADGGAMYFAGGIITINNCDFSNNKAQRGGAFFFTNSTMTLNDVAIHNNEAFLSSDGGQGEGGALQGRGGKIYLTGCDVYENTSAKDGAALSFVDLGVQNVTSCTIHDNVTTKGRGGAIFIAGGQAQDVQVLQSAIYNNDAPGAHGGGVFFQLTSKTETNYVFAGTTISGNHCKQAGGAMFFEGNGLDGQEIKFINCTITANETDDNVGNCPGINFQTGTKLTKLVFINSIVEGNYAIGNNRYSDAWFKDSPVEVKNSIIGYIYDGNMTGAAFTANDASDVVIGCKGPEGKQPLRSMLGALTAGHYYPVMDISPACNMADNTLNAGYKDQLGNAFTTKLIGAVQETTTNHGFGMVIPGVIDCAKYDVGGDEVAYGGFEAGQTPNRGSDHVGWTNANAWVTYTVDVEKDGIYDVIAEVSTGAAPFGFTISDFDTEEDYCVLNFTEPTANWDTYAKFTTKAAVELKKGTVTICLNAFKTINVKSVEFVYNEDATAIQTVAPVKANNKWYNLQGVEVAQPTKGIFIHNGKKYVVK